MSMHRATKEMEAGAPPSPELLAGLGPLMEEMNAAGILIAGEGLRPSVHGVRLNFSGGQHTVTRGPLAGSNELLDRYLIVNTRTIDEAIEWATRFAGNDDTEIDVRPVTEPWDFGWVPKPPELNTTRYMILRKADARSERGNAAPLGTLADEMTRAGVLLAHEALTPSAKGVRLRFRPDGHTVIDGPFTESKELIAGFSITKVSSMSEAVDWAKRFAALFGHLEIEIRPLYDFD